MVSLKRHSPLHQVNAAILQAVSTKRYEDGYSFLIMAKTSPGL